MFAILAVHPLTRHARLVGFNANHTHALQTALKAMNTDVKRATGLPCTIVSKHKTPEELTKEVDAVRAFIVKNASSYKKLAFFPHVYSVSYYTEHLQQPQEAPIDLDAPLSSDSDEDRPILLA
jgi:hypothetical protein